MSNLKKKLAQHKANLLAHPHPLIQHPLVNKLLNLWLSANFLRYLFIGFSSFFMQVALLFVFTNTLKFPSVNGNIFSTLITMVFNFVFSNFWTFKSGTSGQTSKVGKYLVVAAFNYIFDTMLAFPFLVGTLLINIFIAKIIITAIIVMWNFFIYKFWIFKKTEAETN